jgi:hypothetical protein
MTPEKADKPLDDFETTEDIKVPSDPLERVIGRTKPSGWPGSPPHRDGISCW